MITEQDYINAEEQYINLTDEEVGQLAQKAADAQPALFVYVATYYDFLKEDDNKEFFIQMIYSTWIAYNNKYKLKKKLTIEDVEKMQKVPIIATHTGLARFILVGGQGHALSVPDGRLRRKGRGWQDNLQE